MTFAMKYS